MKGGSRGRGIGHCQIGGQKSWSWSHRRQEGDCRTAVFPAISYWNTSVLLQLQTYHPCHGRLWLNHQLFCYLQSKFRSQVVVRFW